MKTREKNFQEKSLKFYRGANLVLLVLRFGILLVADIAMLVYAYTSEHPTMVACLIDVAVCSLTFVLGSTFKEIMIRCEK